MRTFKHKITGDTAKQNGGDYVVNFLRLPARLVENSNDWEEVNQEPVCDLFYDQLKRGEVYCTYYEGQGKYIFDFSGTTFYRHDPKNHTCYLNNLGTLKNKIEFSPSNGFHKFRIADQEERKLLKVKLFTSEDGIDIFEGDSYTFIWTKTPARGQSINKPYTCIARKLDSSETWDDNAKFFSTEVAAKEYLKNNTPLLITDDGVKIFQGQSWWYVAHNRLELGARETNTLVYNGNNQSEVSKFSTKEAADKWIKENRKPNFITEDGVRIFPGDKYYCINPKTHCLWGEICNQNTHANKNNFYFSNKDKAREYYVFKVGLLSIDEIATVFSTAKEFSVYKKAFGIKAQALQRMVLKKLTEY